MPQSRRHAARRHSLAQHRGVILGGSARKLVRNQLTGRVLPCCLEDCQKDGDNRYQVRVPHEDPRWRDEASGTQEALIYIFCSPRHQDLWMAYYKKRQADAR